MKNLFILICLCLCIKSYSQSSVQDSSFITYKDAVNGVSFKYPVDWDSTYFSKIISQSKLLNGNYFGVIFPRDTVPYKGFFYYNPFTLSQIPRLDLILEVNTDGAPRMFPNAIVTNHKILETKNKIKYAYVEAKNVDLNVQDMTIKGLTFIEIVFTNSTTVFDFRFFVREGYIDKYRSHIEAVANSFQFDK
jgi:hypothetical protein